MRFITDEAVKCDDGAVVNGTDMADKRGWINLRLGQLKFIVDGCSRHENIASAATDRRKVGDFVAARDARVPSGKLLIARSDQ